MSRTSTASLSRRNPERPRGSDPAETVDSPEGVRATLAGLGLRPSRALGQSFLTDPFVADAEAALVATGPDEPVVEVGGGLGILTEALLRRGVGPVTVLEKDPRLAAFLRRRFRGEPVAIVTGDALALPFPRAGCFVGNLPFSVATPILLRLFEARVPRVVAMVQREVAERLAAGPGSRSYGRLSIVAALYGEVALQRTVAPGAFTPEPAVEGRIVTFRSREGRLPVPSVPTFDRVVRTLFSSRRKQLGNLLPRLVPGAGEADRLARAADWPSDWARERPESLPPEAFFRLAGRLAEAAPRQV